MGILEPKQQKGQTAGSTKRRSTQLDFSNLAPLKSGGTVGFSAFRDNDPAAAKSKKVKKTNGSAPAKGAMVEDSDEDDDDVDAAAKMKMDDVDDKPVKTNLSPEDAKFSGELADGVGRIKVSRK